MRRMRKWISGLLLGLISTTAPAAPEDRGEAWWKHVRTLADDGYEGRGTGKPGHERAADYVIGQLRALGLKPAGIDGYKQPVAFTEQVIARKRVVKGKGV